MSQAICVRDVDTGLFKKLRRKLRKSIRKVGKTVKKVGKLARPLGKVAKLASGVVSFVPGVGTAAGAALGAAGGALSGEGLKGIAKGAALGGVPGGRVVQGAVQAAKLAKRMGLDKAAMRALRAKKRKRGSTRLVTGSMRRPDIFAERTRSARRAKAPTLGTASQRLAYRALSRSPALVAQRPNEIARRTGIPVGAVRQVKRHLRGLRWRPLSRQAARWVKGRYPIARYLSRGDTQGLSPDGLTYTVETGDYASKIAEKLVGDANRWKELTKANSPPKSLWTAAEVAALAADDARKAYAQVGNFKTLSTGDILKLPDSWVVETETEETESEVTAAEIMKSVAILVAWSKSTDGTTSPLTNYGTKTTDLDGTWDERDKVMLAAFARFRGNGTSTDGEIRQVDVDQLASWAEEQTIKATTTTTTTTTPTVTVPTVTPTIPTVITIPSITGTTTSSDTSSGTTSSGTTTTTSSDSSGMEALALAGIAAAVLGFLL